ncbi:glycosyltransferase [Paenibacillus amylolyticus]|uniref:glycosyltransferase n=1 Tax=Paenibacillus amylolyticus TaxID=1451 RepID=UPI003EBACB4A
MARFLLLTLGSGGDLYPFLRIGKALISEGHEVTLVTHCVYKENAEKYGFKFVGFDTLLEYQLVMNDEFQMKMQDPKVYVEFTKRYLFPKLERAYKQIIEVCDSDTIVIAHSLTQALAQMISEKLSLRYITVFLAPSFLESIIKNPGYIMEYLAKELNYLRNKVGLEPIQNWRGMLNYYNQAIAFWPEWFANYRSEVDLPITYAGFLLHNNLEAVSDELMHWFEESNPVIISHGTTPAISDSFYSSCISACVELEYPSIVVSKSKQVIPAMFQSVIRHEAFLPFSKVMDQAKLLIHHGGIGTMGQAMKAGVPQLILGNGFDRPLNGLYVKKLEVADYLPLPKWTKGDVISSLEALIKSNSIESNCKEVAYKVSQMNVEDQILQVANTVLNTTKLPDVSGIYSMDSSEEAKIQIANRTSSELIELLKKVPAEKRSQLLKEIRR